MANSVIKYPFGSTPGPEPEGEYNLTVYSYLTNYLYQVSNLVVVYDGDPTEVDIAPYIVPATGYDSEFGFTSTPFLIRFNIPNIENVRRFRMYYSFSHSTGVNTSMSSSGLDHVSISVNNFTGSYNLDLDYTGPAFYTGDRQTSNVVILSENL